MKRQRSGLGLSFVIVAAVVLLYAIFSTIPEYWIASFFSICIYYGSLAFASIIIARIGLENMSQSGSDWVITFPISYIIRSKIASILNRKKKFQSHD